MAHSMLQQGWRMARRDWRGGELQVVALALLVAVTAVTAVGFFTDRVRGAMLEQAAELLAADRVVQRSGEIPAIWLQQAEAVNLRHSITTLFRSVVLAGDALQLAEVKAVDSRYPLRGELRIADQRYGTERPIASGPPPGDVWLDPQLADRLQVAVEQQIELGELSLRVGAILRDEPDRGADLFTIAPRLLMHRDDLAASGLLGSGALRSERLLLAGEPAALARFDYWLQPQLDESSRLISGREARPELQQALERAERYLGLAALVSLLLAGIAIATSAHHYALRQRSNAALLRCLGVDSATIGQLYLLQIVLLALVTAALGGLLGYLAQWLLAAIIGDLFALSLPVPSLLPWFQGLLIGVVTVVGFALPPLWALRRIPPLQVLRQPSEQLPQAPWFPYLAAGTALFGLLLWQAGDLKLALQVAAGTLLTLLLLWLLAALLVALLGLLRRGTGISWRFGLLNIPRRAAASRLQIMALGSGIMVLLLLSLVRLDLLAHWRNTLPLDAPNHFLIDIRPTQVDALADLLAQRRGVDLPFYPMVRGRLERINSRPVSAADYRSPRAQRLVRREFNLSWSDGLLPGNRLLAGTFHGEDGGDGEVSWSLEQGLAESLAIELGDWLQFRIGDRHISGRVDSLREVDWDSFQVNFFVLTQPGVLEPEAASWITSLYLPPDQRSLLTELIRQFPNVTVIDVAAIMERVRMVIDRVILAVEFVFLFTLLAGITVLLAALQASHRQRQRELALLRSLGVRRRALRQLLLAEFLTLGGVAGGVAALVAALLGWLLATQLFGFDYRPDPLIVWVGIAIGSISSSLIGWWHTRRLLERPPLPLLRQDRQ